MKKDMQKPCASSCKVNATVCTLHKSASTGEFVQSATPLIGLHVAQTRGHRRIHRLAAN